jgi:hypothetical protein
MVIERFFTSGDLAVNDAIKLRWATYVMARGPELADLLKSHFGNSQRAICFIMGRGFDPRMNLGLSTILNGYPQHSYRVVALEFSEGPNSPSNRYASLVEQNSEELSRLTEGRASVEPREVTIWSPDGRRVGSRAAANLFQQPDELKDYTDIVVDISSLPRSIFYPLVAKLLYLVERQPERTSRLNLFVLVSENSEIDQRIVDEGVDEEADYVDLFRSGADRMASARHPKVWVPILGESQALQLRRIHDLVTPDEICPVLPSPSLVPRRADMLLAEYHGLLFDQMRVEPQNFIYASERNPFEVYRQMCRTIQHYNQVLKSLGGCRTVVSSVSSKLLSVGGLLAAYELKRAKLDIAIAHVEAQGYSIVEEETIRGLVESSSLFALWLSGECYD